MARLNIYCTHDDSDEDCLRCIRKGYITECPVYCDEFDDGRQYRKKKLIKKRVKNNGKIEGLL